MANDIIDLFAVNPHVAFHINAVINSYTVHFMLDTGAAVSLLSNDTWNKIKGTSTLTPWTNPGLVGVGGTPLRVSGIAKLCLELGGQQYHVEMVVADLRTEGILGLDFLETNQCAIDLPQGTMKLKGKDQPISLYRTGNATHQMEDVSVVLPNDVSIPGCTEIEIGAVIRGEVASGTMMVERRVLPQEPSILLATSVVDIQEDTKNPLVPIRLLNLSPDNVTVHKGTRVASAFALENHSIVVASIDNNNPPSQGDVSSLKQQRLWQAVESAAETLTQTEQEQLYAVLLDYADVFADDAGDLGKTDKLQHTINTGCALPVRQAARRLPAAQRVEVRKLLKEMEEKRIIRPSKSPWASPVVLVKKKDGST